jgi:hypothetical protein
MNYCAFFIRSSVVIGLRLGKSFISDPDSAIQKYISVLDMLMQNFQNQVLRDVEIFVYCTGKGCTCF